jgi:hypothetical protein
VVLLSLFAELADSKVEVVLHDFELESGLKVRSPSLAYTREPEKERKPTGDRRCQLWGFSAGSMPREPEKEDRGPDPDYTFSKALFSHSERTCLGYETSDREARVQRYHK